MQIICKLCFKGLQELPPASDGCRSQVRRCRPAGKLAGSGCVFGPLPCSSSAVRPPLASDQASRQLFRERLHPLQSRTKLNSYPVRSSSCQFSRQVGHTVNKTHLSERLPQGALAATPIIVARAAETIYRPTICQAQSRHTRQPSVRSEQTHCKGCLHSYLA